MTPTSNNSPLSLTEAEWQRLQDLWREIRKEIDTHIGIETLPPLRDIVTVMDSALSIREDAWKDVVELPHTVATRVNTSHETGSLVIEVQTEFRRGELPGVRYTSRHAHPIELTRKSRPGMAGYYANRIVEEAVQGLAFHIMNKDVRAKVKAEVVKELDRL